MSEQQATRNVIVKARTGIHLRSASRIASLANMFEAGIMIQKGNERVNAKSIIGLVSLAAGYDTVLTVTAIGGDGDRALEAIGSLFDIGFGES